MLKIEISVIVQFWEIARSKEWLWLTNMRGRKDMYQKVKKLKPHCGMFNPELIPPTNSENKDNRVDESLETKPYLFSFTKVSVCNQPHIAYLLNVLSQHKFHYHKILYRNKSIFLFSDINISQKRGSLPVYERKSVLKRR